MQCYIKELLSPLLIINAGFPCPADSPLGGIKRQEFVDEITGIGVFYVGP
jgi:hypothetical protein